VGREHEKQRKRRSTGGNKREGEKREICKKSLRQNSGKSSLKEKTKKVGAKNGHNFKREGLENLEFRQGKIPRKSQHEYEGAEKGVGAKKGKKKRPHETNSRRRFKSNRTTKGGEKKERNKASQGRIGFWGRNGGKGRKGNDEKTIGGTRVKEVPTNMGEYSH